jgi:SAM-dependent methyltransferase
MTWTEAGDAWGTAAADWAALMDPWTMPIYLDVFDHLGVGRGDRLLDVACGSGLAAVEAQRRGARVSGLDAASMLVDIARMRLPECDLRVGDMFDLPWPDDAFDRATSFNGVFGGCEQAVAEMARVVRPGGRVAITFWSIDGNDDMLNTFGTALGELAPPAEQETAVRLIEIAMPGVAEKMMSDAGLTPVERDESRNAQDFIDLDAVVRAYSATGPAQAAIQHVGAERWTKRLRELYAPYSTPTGIVRLVNTIGWIICER